MEQWMLPLHFGWRREIVFRLEVGTTLCDVYYHSPSGLKMRSLADLRAFFADKDSEPVSIENFTFSKLALIDARETVRIAGPRGTRSELQFLEQDVKTYLINYNQGQCDDPNTVMYRLRNFLVINLRKILIATRHPQFMLWNHIRDEMENEWIEHDAQLERTPISLVYRTGSSTWEPTVPIARGGVPRSTALGRDDQRPSTSDNGAQRPGTAAGSEVSRARQRKQRFPRRVEGDRVPERLSPTPDIPGTSQSQRRASSPSDIPGTSQAQERGSSPLAIPSTSQSQPCAPAPAEFHGTSQSQEHASSHPHIPSTPHSQRGPLPLARSHIGPCRSEANIGSRALPLPPAPGGHSFRPFSQSHQSPPPVPQIPSSPSEPSRALPPPLPVSIQYQLKRRLVVGPPLERCRRAPRTTDIGGTQQTSETPGRVGRTHAPRPIRPPRVRRAAGAPRVQQVLRVPAASRQPRKRRNMRSPTQAQGRNEQDSRTETGREGLRQALETDQEHTTDSGRTDDRSVITPIATYPETSAVIPQSESTSTPQSEEDPDEEPNPRCPRNPVPPQSGFTSTETRKKKQDEESKLRRPRERLPHKIFRESRRQTRHRKTRPGPQSSTRAITRVSSILRMAPGSNRPQMIRVQDTLVSATSASSRSQVTPIPSGRRARRVPSRAIAPVLHAPPASSLPAESRLPQVPQESQPREDLHSFPRPVHRKRIRSPPETREESQTSQGSKRSRSSQSSRSRGPKTPKSSGQFLQSSSPQPSTSREESASPQPTTSRQDSASSQPSTSFQDAVSPQMSTWRKTQVSTWPLEDSATGRPVISRQEQRPTERQESTRSRPPISRKGPVSMWPPSSLEDLFSSLLSSSKKGPISSGSSSSDGDDD